MGDTGIAPEIYPVRAARGAGVLFILRNGNLIIIQAILEVPMETTQFLGIDCVLLKTIHYPCWSPNPLARASFLCA